VNFFSLLLAMDLACNVIIELSFSCPALCLVAVVVSSHPVLEICDREGKDQLVPNVSDYDFVDIQ
jgi:hypothetical protein